MRWKRFDEELPPTDTQILIIVERALPITFDDMNYNYYISSGKFTLLEGLRVDALVGRAPGGDPFMWSPMIDLPFHNNQKEKLSKLKGR